MIGDRAAERPGRRGVEGTLRRDDDALDGVVSVEKVGVNTCVLTQLSKMCHSKMWDSCQHPH